MSNFCVWLTGLPASGKTTLALALDKELREMGLRPVVLDGDDLRKFLYPELGFSRKARQAQAERATYLATLIQKAGGVPIVALISPYRADRAWARQQIKGFVEVFVDCPPIICAQRDPKGLWERAKRGELAEFTGVSDPYEKPSEPEVVVFSGSYGPSQGVKLVLAGLGVLGHLDVK